MVDMVSSKKNKRTKNTHFKLSTDWIIQEPIDYEHKFYVLMDFIKFCDDKIDKFELYPLFSELSLHLANLQSISSEFKYIKLNKKFTSVDDEILIKELKYEKIPNLNDEQLLEFNKILKKAGLKFYEYFNIVKALWNITYDSVAISLKSVSENTQYSNGVFYFEYEGEKNIWKYELNNEVDNITDSKFKTESIYKEKTKKSINTILKSLNIDDYSTIFEIKISNSLPLESALIPIFKRKILSYIIQSNTIGFLKKI
jgi:hypothetical protein